MGVIAVIHVFISHFAIGGGLYLVVTERRARQRNDQHTLAFLEKLSKFFALTTLVAGALTGVGIWFIIGLISPSATEALIHHYVWGWAIEWTFFVVEIAAAILYYYGWKRMAPAAHMTLGWIYFVAAWLSLVVINGIITFMLTPGTWLQTGNFWDGFFNPTYWPSLVFRTGICVMLAGLYGLLVASREEAGDSKQNIVRYTIRWSGLGWIVTVLSLAWYWNAIPVAVTTTAVQVMPTPISALAHSSWLAGAIGLLLALGWWTARRLNFVLAVLLMLIGLAWFGAFETFRESIRKPYVITGYMYGNGVELASVEKIKKDGILPHLAYRTGDDGADLFRHACRSCHTLDGYKPLRPAFDGTDRAFIAATVRATHLLKGNMPPFVGTAEEADKIAGHIHGRVDHAPITDGARAYEVRCGKCHVTGTKGDKSKLFTGQSADDISAMLDMAENLGAGMPAYTGGKEERAALVKFLQENGKQVAK
jgi:mono/diheme cytochrome c family protein